MTLRHLLIGIACLEFVFGLSIAFRAARAEDLDADGRRRMGLIGAAVMVGAVALVLFALFIPQAQMRLA